MLPFRDMLARYDVVTMKRAVDHAQAINQISITRRDTVNAMLADVDRFAVYQISRELTSKLLERATIYDLFRLELRNKCLVHARLNTKLSNLELLDTIAAFDPDMLYGGWSVEDLRLLMHVVAYAAIYYGYVTKHNVEVATILSLDSEPVQKSEVLKQIRELQTQLHDFRRGANKELDNRVFIELKRNASTASKKPRAKAY